MTNKPDTPHKQNKPRVKAQVVADKYNVSSRYILQLAAQSKIPCIRIGKKCVRFELDAVSAAIEESNYT